VKTWIAGIAMFSLIGVVSAAPDELEDAYGKLKEAQTKKDADEVKKWAAETSKLARALVSAPQPTDASEVDTWKQRVEYGKDVDTYTEYALSATAMQSAAEPGKVIALVDALIAQNPKSKYLDECAGSYLAALEKQGGEPKQFAAANQLVAATPNNEFVLLSLATGNQGRKSADKALNYANKLVNVMKSKPKPEGVSQADWDRRKTVMLGRGYWIAGVIEGEKQAWVDCDKNLRAALPLIGKEPSMAGAAFFYLGLSNYQLGKMVDDKAKKLEGLKFSDQAAAIPGPYSQPAYRNSMAIKSELLGRR
jgi:hypothetical protein